MAASPVTKIKHTLKVPKILFIYPTGKTRSTFDPKITNFHISKITSVKFQCGTKLPSHTFGPGGPSKYLPNRRKPGRIICFSTLPLIKPPVGNQVIRHQRSGKLPHHGFSTIASDLSSKKSGRSGLVYRSKRSYRGKGNRSKLSADIRPVGIGRSLCLNLIENSLPRLKTSDLQITNTSRLITNALRIIP